MKHENKYSNHVSEPIAMTYGMSDELRNSDILSRISGLSISDKRCLIGYISEEVEMENLEEDEWDLQDTSDLKPYTLDELYARIEESENDIREGRIYTEAEVREELRKEFPWLSPTSGTPREVRGT